MKIILFVILFMFSGCNIEFGWAGSTPSGVPLDENETVPPDENENETVPPDEDENETVPPNEDENETVPPSTESDFDMQDAILDEKACGAFTGFLTMKDNSFDPEGFYDNENGITLGSSYPMSFNPIDTEVVLFYPTLNRSKNDVFTTIYEENYYISFDQAWVGNTDRTVYVKTPQLEETDNKYGCYRYELNSVNSNINGVKVYRFN
ncbi:MAG: hypothetical protein U9P72_08255 [Campylobacterota bacterium]|nr:hypothetical protein [Campylobacterota bacterium]